MEYPDALLQFLLLLNTFCLLDLRFLSILLFGVVSSLRKLHWALCLALHAGIGQRASFDCRREELALPCAARSFAGACGINKPAALPDWEAAGTRNAFGRRSGIFHPNFSLPPFKIPSHSAERQAPDECDRLGLGAHVPPAWLQDRLRH